MDIQNRMHPQRGRADESLPFGMAQFPRLLPIVTGALIGTSAAILYNSRPLLVALAIAGLLVLAGSLLFKNAQLYWLTIFVACLQLDVKKNLGDGVAVMDALGIDYMQYDFVPEIRASDLAMLMLTGIWIFDVVVNKRRFYFPKIAWIAVAYLAWAMLSSVKAPSAYLSFVELSRQLKFFFVFLYAANNIKTSSTLSWMGLVLLGSLCARGRYCGWRSRFTWPES